MAGILYNKGWEEVINGVIDIDTDTLKMMLIGTGVTYTPNKDDELVDAGGANDLIDAELNGVSGYTRGWGGAGRKTVTVTLQANDTNDRVDIAIADLTWTALGAGDTIAYAVLIKEGGSDDTTSRPIACFDVTDTPTNGSDVTLDFLALGSGGNIRLTL